MIVKQSAACVILLLRELNAVNSNALLTTVPTQPQKPVSVKANKSASTDAASSGLQLMFPLSAQHLNVLPQ
jgi:hypothetical protein